MRILVVSNLCPPHFLGGYELGALAATRALIERGHEVLFLTSTTYLHGHGDPDYVRRVFQLNDYRPGKVRNQAINAYLKHLSHVSCFHNTNQLLVNIEEFEPDAVYLFNLVGLGALALIDALNVTATPWVWHLMDVIPDVVLSKCRQEVLSLYDATGGRSFENGAIISMSQNILRQLEDARISIGQKITIIPGWIDTAWASNGQTKTRANGQNYQFLNAGAIEKKKGIELIVDAAALLKARGNTNFKVDFFGPGQREVFRELANKLAVAELLEFHAPISQSELQRKYSSYDCFLFPTHANEPFGFVPLEAAASGCVPILTRECGASERLVDGVHCLKIDRTASDLAEKMFGIITGQISLPPLQASGKRHVQRELSINQLIVSIENVINETAAAAKVKGLSVSQAIHLQYLKDQFAAQIAFPTEIH